MFFYNSGKKGSPYGGWWTVPGALLAQLVDHYDVCVSRHQRRCTGGKADCRFHWYRFSFRPTQNYRFSLQRLAIKVSSTEQIHYPSAVYDNDNFQWLNTELLDIGFTDVSIYWQQMYALCWSVICVALMWTRGGGGGALMKSVQSLRTMQPDMQPKCPTDKLNIPF